MFGLNNKTSMINRRTTQSDYGFMCAVYLHSRYFALFGYACVNIFLYFDIIPASDCTFSLNAELKHVETIRYTRPPFI